MANELNIISVHFGKRGANTIGETGVAGKWKRKVKKTPKK